MLSRILAIFSISLIFTQITESGPVLAKASRQYLTGVPGFIPVYIRPGETPLEDINPDLAAAFNFHAQKYGRLSFARSFDEKPDGSLVKNGFLEQEIDKVALDDEEDNKINEPRKADNEYSNIQKIKKS